MLVDMAKKRKPRAPNPWPARLRKLQGERSNQEMADTLGVSLRAYVAWKWGERHPPKVAQTLIALLLEKS